MQEGLPVESYFLSEVSRLELSNYSERYSGLFLKRRTDPLAMRGEKIFVQNCITCHSTGKIPSLTDGADHGAARQKLASGGHPPVKGSPKLNDRDFRALVNYLDAYRAEQVSRPASSAANTHGDQVSLK